jgi:hypothetical protein
MLRKLHNDHERVLTAVPYKDTPLRQGLFPCKDDDRETLQGACKGLGVDICHMHLTIMWNTQRSFVHVDLSVVPAELDAIAVDAQLVAEGQ